MPNDNSQFSEIQAVGNTLDLLNKLVENEGATLLELTEQSDLSKSSIYNHLQTLEKWGYVTKADGQYQPGLQFLTLGGLARRQLDLYHRGRQTVDTVAEETGELALITTKYHDRSISLYQARGSHAVTTDSYVGTRFPLHCTATGKAMLSMMDRDEVRAIIDREGLPELTTNTITSADVLFSELKQIENQKIAFDREERLQSMRGVASPIVDRVNGEVVGALSVTGPKSRLNGDLFETELPKLISQNAEAIEVDITYA